MVGAAPQFGQFCVAAYVQRRQLVVAAFQRSQGGVAAHIQRRQLVVLATQHGQGSVFAHVQRGQLVVVAIQRGQGGEVLDALEVGDPFIVAPHKAHVRNLRFGQVALAACIESFGEISAEILIREVDFIDQQVAVFIHLRGGAVEGAIALAGLLRHSDGQGDRHGIMFRKSPGVVVVAHFHRRLPIFRGSKGHNAGAAVICAAGDIAHAGQVFHAHKAAQIQQQLALLPIGGRGRCLRCAN